MKRSTALAVSVTLAVSSGVVGFTADHAHAQRTVTISVLHGDDRPQATIWYRFRDIVEDELPGEYNFRIVTNAALGGERETAEGVRLGSIQGGMSTLANMSSWLPEAQVFDMPYVFEDASHINAVVQGDVGQSILEGLADEGFRALGYVIYGARHLISTQPIREPADVQGMPMRVIESPLHMGLWEHLGANATPVPIPEAYGAMETGVVEAMDFTKTGYESFRLYEVAPYFSLTGHIWSLGVLYFSDDFWQSLPDDHQSVFEEAAHSVITLFNEETEVEHEESIARTEEQGATIIEIDREQWESAIRPFWEEFADNVGGLELIEEIAETR